MADAGIVAVSWFPLTKVVFEPFQLMVASGLKPLPLTVKVNAGLPAFALFGASCVIAGTAPGCGAEAAGLLYPHPETTIASSNSEINFMALSNRASLPLVVLQMAKKRVSRYCHFLVKEMSFPVFSRIASYNDYLKRGWRETIPSPPVALRSADQRPQAGPA